MTLRELGNAVFDWFNETWVMVVSFVVDMFRKIINGDFLDLTIWQFGLFCFLLYILVVRLHSIYKSDFTTKDE